MKMFKMILPVLLLIGCVGAVSAQSTTSATPALDILVSTAEQFSALPSGQTFSYTFPEETLNQAASEALKRYESQVKSLIRTYVNMDLSVSDPKVDFLPFKEGESNVKLSLKVGYGFVKLTVKANGILTLENGLPTVEIQELDVPIISVPLDRANAQVAYYLNLYGVDLVNRNVALTKIETTDDSIIVEGQRK